MQKQKSFSGIISPHVDSLPISVTINPLFGEIYADKLVLGSPMNSENIMNVFSLPGMEFLYSAIHRGRGPDEFLAVNWAHSMLENTVSLYDIPNARLRNYHVSRDTLRMIREYGLKEKMDDGSGLTMPYVSMIQMNESQFMARAAGRAFDILKLLDLESGETESVIPNLFEKRADRDQYLDYNYVFGFGNNRLVRAYRYFDRIEIFSKNEDGSFTPTLTITDSGNYENNLDSEDRVAYYLDIVCRARHIYLLYSGEKQGSDTKSVVEIFDYDGNSVSSISLDRPLSMIMVDEEGRKMYGIDPYNPEYIYIYNFEQTMK